MLGCGLSAPIFVTFLTEYANFSEAAVRVLLADHLGENLVEEACEGEKFEKLHFDLIYGCVRIK